MLQFHRSTRLVLLCVSDFLLFYRHLDGLGRVQSVLLLRLVFLLYHEFVVQRRIRSREISLFLAVGRWFTFQGG